jgi:3-hydroxyacyl-CoA dehydrogenase/enoyl-CoA hydratase/3-hydroxybutyryl-CoA epimerase
MALFQTKSLWIQELAEHVAGVVLDSPGKTNLLDADMLRDLEQALTALEGETRFQVAVLRSHKAGSFCHGTDPLFLAGLPPPSPPLGKGGLGGAEQPEAFRAYAELGQRVCAKLAGLRVPTVAMVNGACLGSGLELALACDWRIAVDRPGVTLGFGEIEIGLVPSFGGIDRLLRLTSLQRALQMVLGGKKLGAREARDWGLIDDIARDADEEPPDLLLEPRKRDLAGRPRRTWRQWLTESTSWGRRLILRGAERVLRQRLPDDMPAPWEALELIRANLAPVPTDTLAAARESMARLGESPAFRNLARLHQLREQQRVAVKAAAAPQHLAVLGSSPLALQLVLQAVGRGRNAVLREHDEMTLGVTVLHLVRILQEDVRRGSLSAADYTSQVNSIRPTVSWKHFDGVDVVIDAAPGDADAKPRWFSLLEEHLSPGALLIAAGADASLGRIQDTLRRPGRCAGLYFPPPAGRAAVVEVIAGPATDPATTQALEAWAAESGKTAVVVKDTPGGLIRRVWAPGLYQAVLLLDEGFTPERIEQALRRFGMPEGPLELLDELGLDEFIRLAERLQPVWPNEVASNALLRGMLERRWLGARTGGGFYARHHGRKNLRGGLPVAARPASPAGLSVADQEEEISRRVVGVMVDEAARCLDEGVVASAEALDLAMVLSGWAPHRGGPLRYAGHK